jgi:hypothetical protein
MKPETLDALLIDRELGELPRDVTELLDSYLEVVPAERRHAEVMTRTIATAREAVRRFPELARDAEPQSLASVITIIQWLSPWLVRAAVIAMVATIGAWVGYRAATNSSSVQLPRLSERHNRETVVPEPIADHRDLWARYNVAFDRQSGTFTIAVQP